MAIIVSKEQLVPQVAQVTSQAVTQTPSSNGLDWLNNLPKILETINSILSNGDKVAQTVFHIAEKKGVFNSAEEKKRDYVASDNKPIIETVFKTVEQKPEVKNMINEKFLDDYVNQIVPFAKEKIPENYKKKTVEELIKEFETLDGFKKTIVHMMIKDEIRQLINGAIRQ